MGIECNLIHQLTNIASTTCAPDTRRHVDQHTHTDKRPTARKILGVTCTQNKNTKAMRVLLAESVQEPPGNVGVGPGTGWRSLRKICAARDAVSQGVLRACMGSEAAHLLDEDADVVLDATSIQGVS